MLHTLTALERMSIATRNGEIGTVKDTYFDEDTWTLRYLVVDTGRWLPGRKVLLSPLSVAMIDWDERRVRTNLTRQQVKDSPTVDTDRSVSRQQEAAYFDYYGFPYYWAGPLLWGPMPTPPHASAAARGADSWPLERRRKLQRPADAHLRSTEEVTGYHIEAEDGAIGHVQDFLFDERDWSLRFLAADTRNWWPGGHVLISIERLERVSWDERKVRVGLSQEEIREGPLWNPQEALSPQDEALLHRRAEQPGGAAR